MERREALADLEAFAKRCIAADRFPSDIHRFTAVACPTCGVVPLALTIEHHTGSKKEDFKGRITARCGTCGRRFSVLSFTGAHRKPVREEQPACSCGSFRFLVGECERIEGDEGLSGFFDEGVVVGKCESCDRKRAFVYTD
jgi:ribosomal protein S14